MDLDINTKTTGFSSPSRKYVSKRLDLNDLIQTGDGLSIFHFRYQGEDKLNIKKGDYLVIDRKINPEDEDLVSFVSSSGIKISKFKEVKNYQIWGVVIWALTKTKK